MKMVVNFAETSDGVLNRNQLEHSIKRNFGGFDPEKFNPMEVFTRHCRDKFERLAPSADDLPLTDSLGLIKTSLTGDAMGRLDDIPENMKITGYEMSESADQELMDTSDMMAEGTQSVAIQGSVSTLSPSVNRSTYLLLCPLTVQILSSLLGFLFLCMPDGASKYLFDCQKKLNTEQSVLHLVIQYSTCLPNYYRD